MIEWLTDTLVATSVLMALVLAARRPVARWFGPSAAYCLWALPMLRLILPPLALPRGLVPQLHFGVEPVTATAAGVGPLTQVAAQTALANMPVDAVAVPTAAHVTVTAQSDMLTQIPWGSVALCVWLGGAVLFLVWRTVTYRWMRRDLLNGARLVAHAGAVRIIETRAINAPLAFGVFDKVIALPWGFLADADSETSDFAIAHELEHHAGNDLLALIAMQPLFALHWFNPIGWASWRAVRGDQEAFCDARVMAGRTRAERARYGRLIASMAGGSRRGLAAPMAGPLSGEKPIIQRLKALLAKDVTPARRVLARSLFALAIVAVPATATVSYAHMDEADTPVPPTTPAVPASVAATPSAPEIPRVPEQPAAIGAAYTAGVPEIPAAPPVPDVPDAPAIDELVPPVPPVPPLPPVPPKAGRQADTARDMRDWHAQAGRRAADAARHAAEAGRRAADAARASVDAERLAARAAARAPRVEESLSADGRRHTIRIVRRNGARSVSQTMILDAGCPADRSSGSPSGQNSSRVICTGAPAAAKFAALTALRKARASIASDGGMDAEIRADILADLDREIADAHRETQGS